MPSTRELESVLRLTRNASRQQYICKACRAQAIRQFHSSPSLPQSGFLNRIKESLFGNQETEEAKQQRQAAELRQQEQAKRDAARTKLEVRADQRGREYEVAAIVDTSINPEYVMSSNWDGLRRIGGKKWIKDKLDGGEKYVGFLPTKKLELDNAQWRKLLHHVTVEILALKQAGRDLNEVCQPRIGKGSGWKQTRKVAICVDDEGQLAARFGGSELQASILSRIPRTKSEVATSDEPSNEPVLEEDYAPLDEQSSGEAAPVEREVNEPTSIREALEREMQAIMDGDKLIRANPDRSTEAWESLVLNDPLIKFMILKRILQLTGHRIPDPVASTATTLADLHTALKTKPPPRKLAQSTKMKSLDQAVPNVVVHAKKRSMIAREKEIGRWKVIEDELVARDLPVQGTRFPDSLPRLGVERRH